MSCGYHIKCHPETDREIVVVLGDPVQYFDAADGSVVTDVTQADLVWCSCTSAPSFVLVDQTTEADGDALAGDGTPANPFQIPICCPAGGGDSASFVYVPYDPAVHDPGALEGTGTVADPYQVPLPTDSTSRLYHEGDTAAYDLILPGGTVLPAGDQVPADTIIFVDEAIDGTVQFQNSFEFPAGGPGGDVCAGFDEAAVDCPTVVLGSDGTNCGPTPVEDIQSRHAIEYCNSAFDDAWSTPDVFGDPAPPTLTITSEGSGSIGSDISGGAGIAGAFPAVLTVPTVYASNPDCIMALTLAYGSTDPLADPVVGLDVTTSAFSLDAPVQVCDLAGQATYLFTVRGGPVAGEQVVLDFNTNGGDGSNGVVHYEWTMICGAPGQDLREIHFDLGAAQEFPGGSTIDTGACPAVVFGSGGPISAPADWFSMSAGTEVVESVSPGATAPVGTAVGYVPPGTGPVTYGASAGQSGFCAIPVNCTNDPTVQANQARPNHKYCVSTVTNPNCAQDTRPRCTVRATVTICAFGGAPTAFEVVPVVNGEELRDAVIGWSGAFGGVATPATDECRTHQVYFEVTPDIIVPPGGSFTHSVHFIVRGIGGSVDLSVFNTTCELIPV